ncbi:MAG TPA: glycosyltransferase family 4 protein [Vicinamibacterales bacterium]|nr:glycosyltransferase family 4 protein [Vicinamibacterales bacterium]
MPSVTFAVAGRLDARSGGSVYNRRMAEGLARRGWIVDVQELDDSFPFPTTEALQHASDVLASVEPDRLVLVDGLAFGAMPDVIAHQAARLRLIAIVHLPLAAAVGLDAAVAGRFALSERRALAHATHVIVTGEATRSLMADCGLWHNDVVIVEPGTDRAPLAAGSGSADVNLLTVATLNPGKGHQTLIEALALLSHGRWRLTCVGSVTRHPETADRVRATVSRLGLEAQVSLAGELNEKRLDACYDRSDVVVLASLRETYGMVVAEALARGLPVVATATGAIPALVGNDAGLMVPPGDRVALADALSRMIDDAAFRARSAAGARRVRERLLDWDEAARRLEAALCF